ncbi:MAG TPA: YCF48-related protein, partial [Candidatus Omnitrophota bacterium]|nr:YCF48-related protein [Candidatus Omnitrophota bacterium]
ALLCAVLMFLPVSTSSHAAQWQNISHEIRQGLCALESSTDNKVIYFGTEKGVFKTEDTGRHWECLTTGMTIAVYDIAQDTASADRLLIGTGKGIYASSDRGHTWKRVYAGTSSARSVCRSIAVLGRAACAATDSGVLYSEDAGAHWKSVPGPLGRSAAIAVVVDPSGNGYWYCAAVDGVYRAKDPSGQWDKALGIWPSDTQEDADPDSATADDNDRVLESSILSLCVDPARAGTVCLAGIRGVAISSDNAATWESLPGPAASARRVRSIVFGAGGVLYAASGADVFVRDSGEWKRFPQGMTSREIRSLAAGASTIYAASDDGLFMTGYGTESASGILEKKNEYSGDLPPISAVQAAAISYADADINKIRQWRRQARRKALLPSVDLGVNKDTSDLWHWEGGSTTKDYDDILRKGKEVYEWDVNLKWDLGDLIWNDAQTSIDTRSRLLVQLRSDILDEVTKLYFEYIRVRLEMDSLTLMDKKKLAQKEIRLQEISAQLDGLTDGFFTRR